MTNPTIVVEGYSAEQIQLIKNTITPGASDDELQLFLYWCRQNGFDPLKKHAIFQKRKSKCQYCKAEVKGGCDKCENGYNQVPVFTPTVDGLLSRAELHPDYNGVQGAVVHNNDEFEFDAVAGLPTKHKFGAKDRGPAVGAWATISFKNGRPPLSIWYSMTEYRAVAGEQMINKIPDIMLMKSAFSIAARRAVPTKIEGMHTAEEFGVMIEPPDQPVALLGEGAVVVEHPSKATQKAAVAALTAEELAEEEKHFGKAPESPAEQTAPFESNAEKAEDEEIEVDDAAVAEPTPISMKMHSRTPKGFEAASLPGKEDSKFFEALFKAWQSDPKAGKALLNDKYGGDFTEACYGEGYCIDAPADLSGAELKAYITDKMNARKKK